MTALGVGVTALGGTIMFLLAPVEARNLAIAAAKAGMAVVREGKKIIFRPENKVRAMKILSAIKKIGGKLVKS